MPCLRAGYLIDLEVYLTDLRSGNKKRNLSIQNQMAHITYEPHYDIFFIQNVFGEDFLVPTLDFGIKAGAQAQGIKK